MYRFHFHDPLAAAAFEHDGYVVVDLVDPAALAELRDVFDSLDQPTMEHLSATLVGRSLAENRRISARIEAVLCPAIDEVVGNAAPIGSTFLVKPPGDGGALSLHQDWDSVDEDVSHSMNVWCPLTAVDRAHGTLEVVPGSHKWFRSFRSPTMPSVQVPFGGAVDRVLVPMELRAGQAVLYDHRLLHGSRSNTTGRPRVVAQVGVAPVGAGLVMCSDGGDGETVLLHSVDADAFFGGLDLEASGTGEIAGTSITRTARSVLDESIVLERIEREVASSHLAPAGSDAGVTLIDRLWRRVRSICSR